MNVRLPCNGYAAIIRDANARAEELLILDPEKTHPVIENNRLLYITTLDKNEQRKLLPENVLHIRGISSDGISGISVIDKLRECLGLGLGLQRYASVYFGNGAKPQTVLKVPHKLTKDQAEELKRNWALAHEGIDRSHRMAILTSGTELQTIPVNNDDSQFLQSREFDLKMVANVLGLDPGWLGANFNTSYNSLEMMNRAFLNHSIERWLITWEEELEEKLLSEMQKQRQSYFFEFQRKALERADSSTEQDLLIKQLSYAGLSFNEYRALNNQPPLEGDIGNLHLIPSGFTLLEKQADASGASGANQPAQADTPDDPSGQEEGSPQEPQIDPESTNEPANDQTAERLKNLLREDVRRQCERIGKAIRNARSKGGLTGFLQNRLGSYEQVAIEALSPASPRAAEVIRSLFARLGKETAPENLLNPDQITEEILKDD